jgi:hypothetical protein
MNFELQNFKFMRTTKLAQKTPTQRPKFLRSSFQEKDCRRTQSFVTATATARDRRKNIYHSNHAIYLNRVECPK